MRVKLPKRGINVEDLKCLSCGKTKDKCKCGKWGKKKEKNK